MSKRKRHPVEEKSVRDAREHLADVLYAAAAGKITYITSRGRRIAAVVPLVVADEATDDRNVAPPIEEAAAGKAARLGGEQPATGTGAS